MGAGWGECCFSLLCYCNWYFGKFGLVNKNAMRSPKFERARILSSIPDQCYRLLCLIIWWRSWPEDEEHTRHMVAHVINPQTEIEKRKKKIGNFLACLSSQEYDIQEILMIVHVSCPQLNSLLALMLFFLPWFRRCYFSFDGFVDVIALFDLLLAYVFYMNSVF